MRKEMLKCKDELLKRNGAVCSICGEDLDEENCFVDHILPIKFGDDNSLDNLQLVCHRCNVLKSDRPFDISEYQFEEYIKQLLEQHSGYTNIQNNVRINNSDMMADFVFDRITHKGTETVVAELKSFSSFTRDRIYLLIKRINGYRKYLPKAKMALIFPGILPAEYIKALTSENIELWDARFLVDEFNAQLKSIIVPKNPNFVQTLGRVSRIDNDNDLIEQLNKCPAGAKNWPEYQKLVGKIIENIFCPPLELPISQSADKYSKNRRDFILPNYTLENNTWKFLREKYNADFIVVDAKNSAKEITKQDVFQIANYLKCDGTGMFGIIIARKGVGDSAQYALREKWLYEHKMIVVLNDDDIEQMILNKKIGYNPAKLLLKKIEDFRLSV